MVEYFDCARVDPAGQTLRVKMLSFCDVVAMVTVGVVLLVQPLRVIQTGVDA